MVVWLNGTFGAGKTTVSKLLADTLPDARVFDSEDIGTMLQSIMGDVPHNDFKEWKLWRSLTVETARQVLGFVGGTLIIPQTVLQHQYWTELHEGFAAANIPLLAFTLHAERDTITERVETDEVETGAKQWRLDHRDAYESALPWLKRETTIIDTTYLIPEAVAARIAADINPA